VRREFERVACPCCGRTVAAYIPHLADGTDVKLVPHNVWPREVASQRRVADRLIGQRCPASGHLRGELVKAGKE
jgi:hypothetical protein